jgi:hypothetical protein
MTFAEIVSPYDSGVALRTTAVGTTLMACPVEYTARDFQLPGTISSAAYALQLYLALDSNMTTYNWPGLQVDLLRGGAVVADIQYYRAAATGSFIMQRTSNWHAIAANGFQTLPLSPLLDSNSAVISTPVTFDKIRITMVNYTCEGTNSVIIDALSLVSTDPNAASGKRDGGLDVAEAVVPTKKDAGGSQSFDATTGPAVDGAGAAPTVGDAASYSYTGKWTAHGGLLWSDPTKDGEGKIWNDALDYCKAIGARLPTISELRTLITGCPATETGGTCKATDTCLSYTDCATASCDGCGNADTVTLSALGDVGFTWSSSARTDNTTGVWGVMFSSAQVYTINKGYFETVRCVR